MHRFWQVIKMGNYTAVVTILLTSMNQYFYEMWKRTHLAVGLRWDANERGQMLFQ